MSRTTPSQGSVGASESRASSGSKLFLALAAGASVIVLASCTPADGQTAAAPALPEVTVAEPLVDSVSVYDEVVGRFQAVNAIEIRPQVSGRLTDVHFQDGQLVDAGAPLFTIEPAPFEANVDRARAELARAEAQRALASEEHERAETLVERGTVSQEAFDQRARGLQDANAAVDAARAQLRAAEIDLGYTAIAAPIHGRVSDRRVDAGNLVGAGESLLTTIVSQDPIHVEFAVAPDIAGALPRPGADGAGGAAVQIRLEGETEFAHQGRIDFVDNQVDPRAGVIRMRAVLANPDGAYAPGQFVRVRFARAEINDAILVPDAAVNSSQNAKYVLVVNADDVIEPRPIVAGPVVDGLRVVQAGLGTEDRVIVGGSQRAYPGMQVAPTQGSIDLASN